MSPVPPHHLLSAYLDGELSASEREEVERLLERSPEARQELLELEQVGLLLRQLPRQALPESFAPQVLDKCLSDTAIFESETPPPKATLPKVSNAGIPAPRKRSRLESKSWRGLASVVMGATALGLILLLSWPKPDEMDREKIAQQTSPPAADALGLPVEADDKLNMQLAGAGNAAGAINDVRLGQEGQAESATNPTAESPAQSSAVAASEALPGIGTAGDDRKALSFANKELKDLPIGQLAQMMDYQGEQIAVVKLVVADREQGLKDLRQLLQKHQIAHDPPAEPEKAQTESGSSEPKDESTLFAVYVETSEDRLAFVMRDLQKEAAFQKLTMDDPVETAQFDPYLQAPDAKPSEGPRSRMRQFGGVPAVPGPKAFRAAEATKTEKADEAPAPRSTADALKKSAPDKSEAKTEPPKPAAASAPADAGRKTPEEPAAQSRPSAATFKAPAADALREKEKPAPEKEPSANEAKPSSRDKEKNAETAEPDRVRSMQRELLLSPRELEALQKQLAEPAPETPEDAHRKLEAPSESAPAKKPVQVLFLLVHQDKSTEASPPTPAANAPSSTD